MVIKQRKKEKVVKVYSSLVYANKSRRVYEAPDLTLFNNPAASKQVYLCYDFYTLNERVH